MVDLGLVLALPMDYDGMRVDDASLRTNNVNDYKVTCIDFIKDIANDYFAWIDYYKLAEEEDKKRREGINTTIKNEICSQPAQPSFSQAMAQAKI